MVALPSSARDLLALEPHEAVIGVWKGRHLLGSGLLARGVDGYLTLTNRKVAFVQALGIGRHRTFHLLPRLLFPLEAITELREEGPGLLRLSDSDFRLGEETTPAAREHIERARVERLRHLQEAAPRSARHDAAPMVTERLVIREIVKVPCRYCGALNEHGATRCASCGAPASR